MKRSLAAFDAQVLDVLRGASDPLTAPEVAQALTRALPAGQVALGRTVDTTKVHGSLRRLVDVGAVRTRAVKRCTSYAQQTRPGHARAIAQGRHMVGHEYVATGYYPA